MAIADELIAYCINSRFQNPVQSTENSSAVANIETRPKAMNVSNCSHRSLVNVCLSDSVCFSLAQPNGRALLERTIEEIVIISSDDENNDAENDDAENVAENDDVDEADVNGEFDTGRNIGDAETVVSIPDMANVTNSMVNVYLFIRFRLFIIGTVE